MQSFPPLPSPSDASLTGHLWVQELVAGVPLRFRLADDGRIRMATREGPLAEPPAPSLRATVRFVRERLDRDALRDAAADPPAVTFFGVATRFEGVPYDFERLPPFVGTDVHDGDDLLPPDRVEQAFERLGLPAVNALEKEVDADYFDPAEYETPESDWYGGPVAGLVFRSKGGGRTVRRNETLDRSVDALPGAPAATAAAVVTSRRVRLATAMARGETPDFDAVFERVLELIYREEHARLPADLDERAFRSAVAERVRDLR